MTLQSSVTIVIMFIIQVTGKYYKQFLALVSLTQKNRVNSMIIYHIYANLAVAAIKYQNMCSVKEELLSKINQIYYRGYFDQIHESGNCIQLTQVRNYLQTILKVSSIRKDCFQNKSKFTTEEPFTKHMNITNH